MVRQHRGRVKRLGQSRQELLQKQEKLVWPSDVTLPNDETVPSCGREGIPRGGIPGAVSGKLRQPVFLAALRHARATAALVLVPETAMDEDHLPAPREHDVRLAGQVAMMKPVAIAGPPQERADGHLRTRVLRPICPHGGAYSFRYAFPALMGAHQMSGMADATAWKSGGGTALPITR